MQLPLLAVLLTSLAPVQAAEPNRQPKVASVPGLTALVFGSGNSLWISTSHDNGHSFSSAREIARLPVLALGRHRGPRMVIKGDTIVVTAVYGETAAAGPHAHGLPADGDLVAWKSSDEGKSWSAPAVINDTPGAAREGLHAIAIGKQGWLAAAWLDLRSSGTRLYGAYSKDGGAKWSNNTLLYESPGGTICQCCAPSLVFSGAQDVQVMFRNVESGARDMNLLRWRLGAEISKPQKLGTGAWTINACPMDGGGMVQQGGTILTAWRRDKTVYLDEPNRPEVALGEGNDVDIALTARGPYVAWSASSGIFLDRPNRKAVIRLSPSGSFPALTGLPDGSVLAAWEQDGRIEWKVVE